MKINKSLLKMIFATIFIYLVIVFLADAALNASQKSHFETASDSYMKLNKVADKNALEIVKNENELIVATLDLEKNKPQSLNDLWNKKIIHADGKVTTTSNLKKRVFYRAYELPDHKYLIVRHFSKRLWNHHLAYFGLLSVIYLLLGIIVNWYIYDKKKTREYELDALINNLRRIGEGKEISSMIMDSENDLEPFIRETKNLQNKFLIQNAHTSVLNSRFNSLINHLPVGVMLIDNQGNVLMSNRAMSIILGKNVSDIKHPFIDDIKTYSLSRMIEHALRKDRNYRRNIKLIGTSNKYVDANVIRINNEGEDQQQIIVILYDLTKNKKIEQMQTDFVSNVSHELKTPITAIDGFVATLQAGAKKNPDDLNNFLNIISNEVKRLNLIVEDILNLSEIEKNEESTETFSINLIVNEIQERLQKIIEDKNISIKTAYIGEKKIQSSKILIEDIINNIFTNAVLYNKQNGSITVKVNHDNNNLLLSIKDTGIGIADDDINRIFERFYRVDKSHNQKIKGTGLGLAIAAEAIDKLNGTIKVNSQLSVGTEFIINIPL